MTDNAAAAPQHSSSPVIIDPALLDYANAGQRATLEAIILHGSIDRAAKAMGRCRGTLQDVVKRVKARASVQGHSPEHGMTHAVPDTHVVKGVSTLYSKDGSVTSQWVKSDLRQEAVLEVVRSIVLAMVEEVRGQSQPTAPPVISHADLLVVYPMGDPHYGLHATAAECGEDFNLDIAERLIQAAIDNLVSSAPPAETAILLNLGDALHADNDSNRTQSGHVLNVDGRWTDVLRVALRSMIYAINRLLEKHPKVIVRNVCGNHDKHSGFALALAMDAFFSNNPRVTVDLSPAAFWFYRFDKVLIGSTHGDQCKAVGLPSVMACDRAEDWGNTKFRYWLVGHIHHQEVKEYPGVTVESFRTLAARDPWHSAMGFRSGRDMRCIIYHKQHGEIGRYRCDISMIQPAELLAA